MNSSKPLIIAIAVVGALILGRILFSRQTTKPPNAPPAKATGQASTNKPVKASSSPGARERKRSDIEVPFTPAVQTYRREVDAGWARWKNPSNNNGTSTAFDLKLVFEQDCARTPLTQVLRHVNKKRLKLLAELRPINCEGQGTKTVEITKKDLDDGEMTIPFLAKGECVAVFEACAVLPGSRRGCVGAARVDTEGTPKGKDKADDKRNDPPKEMLLVSKLVTIDKHMTRIFTGSMEPRAKGQNEDDVAKEAFAGAGLSSTKERIDSLKRDIGGAGDVYGERSFGIRLSYYSKAVCDQPGLVNEKTSAEDGP